MTGRPAVTLKLATSMDGRIALKSGESQWITSDESRRLSHKLRSEHDAVLVGAGTVLADDPLLTVRLSGYQLAQPLRVVADSAARTPPDGQLSRTASPEAPVLVVAGAAASTGLEAARRVAALKEAGVQVIRTADARPAAGDILAAARDILSELGREPVRGDDFRVMLEGGGELASAFLKAGCVDRIEWFRAPVVIGGDGRPAVAPLALDALSAAPRFALAATERIGDDVRDTYVRPEEG